MIGKEILNDSSFTSSLREEMKSNLEKKFNQKSVTHLFIVVLGYSLEIEYVLDSIYEKLDLLLSYKRRYKHLKFVLNLFIFMMIKILFSTVHFLFMVMMNNQIIEHHYLNKYLIYLNDLKIQGHYLHRFHLV